MDIGKRIKDIGMSTALLGAWAMIASTLSIILNMGEAVDGHGPAISRIMLGLIGLAAAAVFWSGYNYGKPGLYAITAWGALQIPYLATQPDGNFTKQLFDAFLGATSETKVNGEIRDYQQVGINPVGVAVVVWASTRRDRLDLWRRRSASNRA